MTSWLELLDPQFAARAVAVLAHSLWQAPLLAVATWVALSWLPARAANARYAVCLVAMVATVMVAATTWTLMVEPAATADSRAALSEPSQSSPTIDARAAPGGTAAVGNAGDEESSASAVTSDGGEAAWRSGADWQRGVVVVWLLGVSLMLVRLASAFHKTAALATDGSGAPEEVVRLVRELSGRLGIRRRLAVLTSERVSVPGVIGVVWPTLLLPVSMITGLPAEELRAVIAHELVHIRRYDFAVNLAQMVIESLFFFNPAVWWISRRIRIEREACVDAAAVAVTGRPIEYASLLASVAERVVSGAPMPALVGLAERGEGGSLLERVKRVVEPGVSPRVRLPWATLFVLLLLSALVIAAVWQGTSTVVGFAQELMTDAERVERLETAREEFTPDSGPVGKGKGAIRGTVRTEDGRPVPEEGWLYYSQRGEHGSALGTVDQLQRAFSVSVPTGTVWLLADADGYAPVYVGPFQVTPDAVIEDIEIVLPIGFETSIRVTDEKGMPIEGAKIRGGLLKQGGSTGRGEWSTDADGIAHVAHAAEGLYRITAKRPGYQPFEEKVSFSPDRPLQIQLDTARPFLGQVVSPDGQPVPDAKVRALYDERLGDGSGRDHGNWGPTVATTDAEGRFRLDQLCDGWRYVLLVESEGWGRAIMQGVAAGKEGIATMGPRLEVRGEIAGPLDELERNRQGPFVWVFQQAEYRTDRPRTSTVYEKVPVRVEDGVAAFEYSHLMPGEVTIRAGEHLAKTSVSAETPSATVQIDLAEPVPVEESVRRQVVFQFVRDSQPIAIDGRVRVLGHATERRGELVSETLPVADGRACVEIPVPGRVQCRPQGMVGWYFEDVSEGVGRGEGPLRIEIPVMPAGAVQGHVALPPGYPGGEVPRVSVLARWEDDTQRFSSRQDSVSATVDSEGRFFLTPVPLGAQCSVKVTADHNVQVSEVFTLEAAEPLYEVDLRLPRPVSALVEVVDPQGHPVPDLPVKLHWEQRGASGNVWEAGATDRDGRVAISEVNAEVPQYYVEIPSRRTWQPVLAPLDVDGGTTRIELKRGEELVVAAIDKASGFPVPGVEVYAIRHPASTTRFVLNIFEAEARTDEQGKARFSNLPNAKLQVGLRGMNVKSADVGIVHPGRERQIALRGEIPEWSDLRPKRPAE